MNDVMTANLYVNVVVIISSCLAAFVAGSADELLSELDRPSKLEIISVGR